jgi:hypothetical protein
MQLLLCAASTIEILVFDVIARGIFCRLLIVLMMWTDGARSEQGGGGERVGRAIVFARLIAMKPRLIVLIIFITHLLIGLKAT